MLGGRFVKFLTTDLFASFVRVFLTIFHAATREKVKERRRKKMRIRIPVSTSTDFVFILPGSSSRKEERKSSSCPSIDRRQFLR